MIHLLQHLISFRNVNNVWGKIGNESCGIDESIVGSGGSSSSQGNDEYRKSKDESESECHWKEYRWSVDTVIN